MKTAEQIISTIRQRAASGQPLHAQGQNVKRLNRPEIETLWQMMSSMYGHRWSSSYGAEIDPDGVWGAALDGVTPEQIKVGVRAVAKSGAEWPPAAPQFRQMCLGVTGIPDARTAYLECANKRSGAGFSHITVRAAARSVGMFDIKSQPEAKVFPQFKAAFEKAVAEFLAGTLVVTDAPEAEAPALTQFSKAESDAAREQLFKMFGGAK